MATITNKDELQTAISAWAGRSDSTFTGQYDIFIDLTEAMFRRAPEDGGYRGSITRATGSASSVTLALPADFLEAFRFAWTGSANAALLEFVSPEQMKLRFKTGNDKPKYWTVTDVIEFDVTPDQSYNYELAYYAKVPSLSATSSTNFLLTNYPDIYLAGCMFHASRFQQDPESAESWGRQYRIAMDGANKEYKRRTMNQGVIAARTDTSTP